MKRPRIDPMAPSTTFSDNERISESDSEDGWHEVVAHQAAAGPDFATAFGLAADSQPEVFEVDVAAAAAARSEMEVDEGVNIGNEDRAQTDCSSNQLTANIGHDVDNPTDKEKIKDETKQELDDLICK